MFTQLAADFISMRNQHADLQRYKSELEARLTEAEREEEEERRGARPRQQPTQEEVEKFVRLQSEKVGPTEKYVSKASMVILRFCHNASRSKVSRKQPNISNEIRPQSYPGRTVTK